MRPLTTKTHLLIIAAIALAGCATQPTSAPTAHSSETAKSLRLARKASVPVEQRVGYYLDVASDAYARLSSPEGRTLYNEATAEATILLRSANAGTLWNHPLDAAGRGRRYHLRYSQSREPGYWAAAQFTAFVPPAKISLDTIQHRDVQSGVGGALVGVRKKTPQEAFTPLVGVTAPVTATIEFRGNEATLTLRDPSEKPGAVIAGARRPLEADFSAPLAYYPHVNETIAGLMGALHPDFAVKHMGLYMIQPYDPHRIPIVFVHGLISTPRMWRNVVNELEMDPQIRGKYQAWVFGYPTSFPIALAALRLRQDLARAEKTYGLPHGFVLVSHSMGGLLSRMQATTVTRADWERQLGPEADAVLSRIKPDSEFEHGVLFQANPKIKRIVFICTPHRGSDLAINSLGALAQRLVSLPARVTTTLAQGLGNAAGLATGNPGRLPNSITSLSPHNPTLKVMDKLPIQAPHHTILGDRGRGDSPNSSDGVVAYWSSHLDSAKSQKIVPGPHGSCELPETIAELKRILRLHLQAAK